MQRLRESGMDASSGMSRGSRARPPTSGHLKGIRHMLHPVAREWASPNDEIYFSKEATYHTCTTPSPIKVIVQT